MNKKSVINTATSLFDLSIILEIICPIAYLGVKQYFWFIILFLILCYPLSQMINEVKTTYKTDIGFYDWVKKGLGIKNATKIAWIDIFFSLFYISSIAFAILDILLYIFSIKNVLLFSLIFEISISFLLFLLYKYKKNNYSFKVSMYCKIFIITCLGILGLFIYIKTGNSLNSIHSINDLIPSFNGLNIVGLLIISYCYLFIFDNVDSRIKSNNKLSLLLTIFIISLMYILSTFGILDSMKVNNFNISNIVNSFNIIFSELGIKENINYIIIMILSIIIIYVLINNFSKNYLNRINKIISYTNDNKLPYFISNRSNELISRELYISLIFEIIITILMTSFGIKINGFVISLSLLMLLLSLKFIIFILSFIKLRKYDNTSRIYKMPGNKIFIKVKTLVPIVILIISILSFIFKNNFGTNIIFILLILLIILIISELNILKIQKY
jgi:amino acid transporter